MLSKAQGTALLNAHKRWNCLIGATRSGKSYTQQLLVPIRVQENIPGLYVLMAKTQGNVESNILSPMRDMYGPGYVSQPYVRTGLLKAKVFGKEFVCLGGDNIRAVDKVRGKGIGYLFGDEAPTWPTELLQMVKTRLTDPRAKADLNGNPEGPYHPFKLDLLDRAEQLGVYHQRFLLDDNPSLTEEIKLQLKTELQGVWYKRLILGLWVAAEGSIYDMFDPEKHVVNWEPTVKTGGWAACDYGTVNPSSFGYAVQLPDLRMFVLDEWRHDPAAQGAMQMSDAQQATALKEFLAGRGHKAVFIDPSAASFRLQCSPPYTEGISGVANADNAVLDGIRDVATLLASDRLLIHERCTGLIQELSSYTWNANAQKRGEDAPDKKNDHGPDMLRYLIRGTRYYWSKRLKPVEESRAPTRGELLDQRTSKAKTPRIAIDDYA